MGFTPPQQASGYAHLGKSFILSCWLLFGKKIGVLDDLLCNFPNVTIPLPWRPSITCQLIITRYDDVRFDDYLSNQTTKQFLPRLMVQTTSFTSCTRKFFRLSLSFLLYHDCLSKEIRKKNHTDVVVDVLHLGADCHVKWWRYSFRFESWMTSGDDCYIMRSYLSLSWVT